MARRKDRGRDVRGARVARSPLWAGICLALCFSGTALGAETLLLDVSFNDQALDGVTLVEHLDDGRLVLPAEDWARARLKPAGVAISLPDGRTAYALDAIAGLTYELDLSRLTLKVKAPAIAFVSTGLDIGESGRPVPQLPPAGFYVDYDLSATRAGDGGSRQGALLEAVAFNRLGSLVSGLAFRSDEQGGQLFRTDTYWRHDLPSRMQTLVLGDTITSAGGWSRPVRYGGIRFARAFDTAPGYISYPMPSITGSAALPSIVDVLVHGYVAQLERTRGQWCRRNPVGGARPAGPRNDGPAELLRDTTTPGARPVRLLLRSGHDARGLRNAGRPL
jgi:outer membrane usher protein FimD/PapC